MVFLDRLMLAFYSRLVSISAVLSFINDFRSPLLGSQTEATRHPCRVLSWNDLTMRT